MTTSKSIKSNLKSKKIIERNKSTLAVYENFT